MKNIAKVVKLRKINIVIYFHRTTPWKWVAWRRKDRKNVHVISRKWAWHFPSLSIVCIRKNQMFFIWIPVPRKFVHSFAAWTISWHMYKNVYQQNYLASSSNRWWWRRESTDKIPLHTRCVCVCVCMYYVYTLTRPSFIFVVCTIEYVYIHIPYRQSYECINVCSVKYSMMPIHFVILLVSRKINVTPVTSIDPRKEI